MWLFLVCHLENQTWFCSGMFCKRLGAVFAETLLDNADAVWSNISLNRVGVARKLYSEIGCQSTKVIFS